LRNTASDNSGKRMKSEGVQSRTEEDGSAIGSPRRANRRDVRQ
jgi:hypothetical protein